MNPDQVAQMQAQQQQGQPSPEQMAQMQQMQAQQGQQGLGTPPPEQFDFKPNVVKDKAEMLIAGKTTDQIQKRAEGKEQEALAARAEADKAAGQQGYAGYRGDASAGVNEGQDAHPNDGWSPSGEEAHQLNINIADRIKSGQMDPKTATMLAVHHPEVSPEIKQALVQIIQQAQIGAEQQGGSEQQMEPQSMDAGLGNMPVPQQ